MIALLLAAAQLAAPAATDRRAAAERAVLAALPDAYDLEPSLIARLMPIGAAVGQKAGLAAMRETVEAPGLDARKDNRS